MGQKLLSENIELECKNIFHRCNCLESSISFIFMPQSSSLSFLIPDVTFSIFFLGMTSSKASLIICRYEVIVIRLDHIEKLSRFCFQKNAMPWQRVKKKEATCLIYIRIALSRWEGVCSRMVYGADKH